MVFVILARCENALILFPALILIDHPIGRAVRRRMTGCKQMRGFHEIRACTIPDV